jgi:hypothetical protein
VLCCYQSLVVRYRHIVYVSIRICPLLTVVSFNHNEVSPRFLVSSILLCQRMISNTPSYPIHPAIFLWSSCSVGFRFLFHVEIHILAFSNTPSYPIHPAIFLWSSCFVGFRFLFHVEIHILAFSVRVLTSLTS